MNKSSSIPQAKLMSLVKHTIFVVEIHLHCVGTAKMNSIIKNEIDLQVIKKL